MYIVFANKTEPTRAELSKAVNYIKLVLTECAKTSATIIALNVEEGIVNVRFKFDGEFKQIATAPENQWFNIMYYVAELFADSPFISLENEDNTAVYELMNVYTSYSKTLFIKKH